jgi:hypothetical protein
VRMSALNAPAACAVMRNANNSLGVMSAWKVRRSRSLGKTAPALTDSHNQALSDWNRLVQKNRNRIVHAGDAPTIALADDAYQAMLGFESMILDRVANPVSRKRYPLTALFLAKHAGLERRGAWTRSIREAAAAAEKDHLLAVFTRWLDATTYLRMSPELRDAPGQGIVKFAMTRDGNSYWVEHDEDVDLARTVRPIGDVEVFERYARRWREDPADPRYTASFDPSPRVRPSGPWVPAYTLVPGSEVMRDKSLWFEPRSL